MTAADTAQGPAATPLWVRLDAAASRVRWASHRAQNAGLRGHGYVRVGARGHWLATAPRGLDIGTGGAIGSDHSVIVTGHLHIGRQFFANRGLYLCCHERVDIGEQVRLGERVSIHDENHVFEPLDADRGSYTTRPIVIGDRVWLGANTVVVGGAHIGAGTVVGANSVVTGTLPPGVLAAGVPARVVRALRPG